MFEDKEFRIPFDASRRGRLGNEKGKSLGRRAIGRTLRAATPSIGKRNRRGDNRGFGVPTGGKPGKRKPTGSRRDSDRDGWADEGSTNPVWVGIGGQEEKPRTTERRQRTPIGNGVTADDFLASGKLGERPVVEKTKKNLGEKESAQLEALSSGRTPRRDAYVLNAIETRDTTDENLRDLIEILGDSLESHVVSDGPLYVGGPDERRHIFTIRKGEIRDTHAHQYGYNRNFLVDIATAYEEDKLPSILTSVDLERDADPRTLSSGATTEKAPARRIGTVMSRPTGMARSKTYKDIDGLTFRERPDGNDSQYILPVYDVNGEKLAFGAMTNGTVDFELEDDDVKVLPLNPYVISGLGADTEEGREAAMDWFHATHGYMIENHPDTRPDRYGSYNHPKEQSLRKGWEATMEMVEDRNMGIVSALLYAASRGDTEAKEELKRLAAVGKAWRDEQRATWLKEARERVDSYGRGVRPAQAILKREDGREYRDVGIDDLFLVHQTSFEPQRDEDGNISLRPTGDFMALDPGTLKPAIDPTTGEEITGVNYRTSIHFSLNHLVTGHLYRGVPKHDTYAIVVPLRDVLEANPDSLENLMSVDTYLSPPPGQGLVIPMKSAQVVNIPGAETMGIDFTDTPESPLSPDERFKRAMQIANEGQRLVADAVNAVGAKHNGLDPGERRRTEEHDSGSYEAYGIIFPEYEAHIPRGGDWGTTTEFDYPVSNLAIELGVSTGAHDSTYTHTMEGRHSKTIGLSDPWSTGAGHKPDALVAWDSWTAPRNGVLRIVNTDRFTTGIVETLSSGRRDDDSENRPWRSRRIIEQPDTVDGFASGAAYQKLVDDQPRINTMRMGQIRELLALLSEIDERDMTVENSPKWTSENISEITKLVSSIFNGEFEFQKNITDGNTDAGNTASVVTGTNDSPVTVTIVPARTGQSPRGQWSGAGVDPSKPSIHIDFGMSVFFPQDVFARISRNNWSSPLTFEEFYSTRRGLNPLTMNRRGPRPLAEANRTMIFQLDESTGRIKPVSVVHGSIWIEQRYRGHGLGTALNARNEQLYKSLGFEEIFLMGMSGGEYQGATFWPRNGYVFATPDAENEFLTALDWSLDNSQWILGEDVFTDADRQRIRALYEGSVGAFRLKDGVTPEEIVNSTPYIDELFAEQDVQVEFKRNMLASGKTQPRQQPVGVGQGTKFRAENDGSHELDSKASFASGDTLDKAISRQLPLSNSQQTAIEDFDEFILGLAAWGEKRRSGGVGSREEVQQIASYVSSIFDSTVVLPEDLVVDGINFGKTVRFVTSSGVSPEISTWPQGRISAYGLSGNSLINVPVGIFVIPDREITQEEFETLGQKIRSSVSFDENGRMNWTFGPPKTNKSFPVLASISLEMLIDQNGNKTSVHDSILVDSMARGQGIGNAIDAKLEQIYVDLGVGEVRLTGESKQTSSTRYIGATHWPKNGYVLADKEARATFFALIQKAAREGELTDEELSELLDVINFNVDELPESISPEKLLRWDNAEIFFVEQDVAIDFKKNLKDRDRRVQILSEREAEPVAGESQEEDRRLSSGEVLSWGDDNPTTGKAIDPSDRTSMRGLSPDTMANLLVPESLSQHIEIYLRKTVPGFDAFPDSIRKGMRAEIKKRFDDNPHLMPDFSPEAVAEMREMVAATIRLSPGFRWALETFGGPSFAVHEEKSLQLKMQALSAAPSSTLGIDGGTDLAGLTSTLIGFALFPRKFISKEAQQKGLSVNRVVEDGDYLMDDSPMAGVLHEYGHWLHLNHIFVSEQPERVDAFIKAGMWPGTPQNARFVKVNVDEMGVVADRYYDLGLGAPSWSLLKAITDSEEIEFDNEFGAPRAITAYAHTSAEELIAEAVVAVLHPNPDLQFTAINSPLRDDVLALLGINPGEELPWKQARTARRITAEAKKNRALRQTRALMEIANTAMEKRIAAGQLASGRTKRVRYENAQIIKRAMDLAGDIEYEPHERGELREQVTQLLQRIAEKLAKSPAGEGFSVESRTPMVDITSGYSVGRNRHGMQFSVVKSFVDGKPTKQLIDRLMGWLEFHGPDVFVTNDEEIEKVAIGGWVPVITTEGGTMFLDVSDVYSNTPSGRNAAIARGTQEQQISIAHLDLIRESIQRGESDPPEEAFISTNGNGGEIIGVRTIDTFRRMAADARQNLLDTGSRRLRKIGPTYEVDDLTEGAGATKIRTTKIRHVNLETNERQDYWLLAKNNKITVYTDEQYELARERAQRSLLGTKRAERRQIVDELLRGNEAPVASLRKRRNGEFRSTVSREHRGRGLNSAMKRSASLASGKDDGGDARESTALVIPDTTVNELRQLLKSEKVQRIRDTIDRAAKQKRDALYLAALGTSKPLSIDEYLNKDGLLQSVVNVRTIDDSKRIRGGLAEVIAGVIEAGAESISEIQDLDMGGPESTPMYVPSVEMLQLGDDITELGKQFLSAINNPELIQAAINRVLAERGISPAEITVDEEHERIQDSLLMFGWGLGIDSDGNVSATEVVNSAVPGMGRDAYWDFIDNLKGLDRDEWVLMNPGRNYDSRYKGFGRAKLREGARKIEYNNAAEVKEAEDIYFAALKKAYERYKNAPKPEIGRHEPVPRSWAKLSEKELDDRLMIIAKAGVAEHLSGDISTELDKVATEAAELIELWHEIYKLAEEDFDSDMEKAFTAATSAARIDLENAGLLIKLAYSGFQTANDLNDAIDKLKERENELEDMLDELDDTRSSVASLFAETYLLETGKDYQEHVLRHIEKRNQITEALKRDNDNIGNRSMRSYGRLILWRQLATALGFTFGRVPLKINRTESLLRLHGTGSNPMTRDQINNFVRRVGLVYPDQLIEHLNARFANPNAGDAEYRDGITLRATPEGRYYNGSFSETTGMIVTPIGTSRQSLGTDIHEVMHALNASVPVLTLVEDLFLSRRAIGDPRLSRERRPISEALREGVSMLTRRPHDTSPEPIIDTAFPLHYYLRDDLTDSYAGKVYRAGSTEALTRGIEYLFFDIFQTDDEDHLATTLGALVLATIETNRWQAEPGASVGTVDIARLQPLNTAEYFKTDEVPSAIPKIDSPESPGLASGAVRQPEPRPQSQIGRKLRSRKTEIADDGVRMAMAEPLEELSRHHGETRNWQELRAVDARRRKMIADAYELMENLSDLQEVRASWDELEEDIRKQFKMLTEQDGITVEFVDDDPYATFEQMYEDVVKNRRLKILKTESTGGHPYWPNEVNDMFRAVHDAYGHLATGRGFDRHGEEAAFQAHKTMFRPGAIPALNTELRAQNSFLIDRGDFGPQKVALLPAELLEKLLATMRTKTKKIITSDDDNAYEKGGSHHVSCGRFFGKTKP